MTSANPTIQSSQTQAVLVADNLHKSYAMEHTVVTVLKGASLAVNKGEAVAVTGPSGAGKSTLMHVLGGLDAPDKGRVMLEGRDVYGASQSVRSSIRASQIGFVFQSYHLLPELTVLENTMLPAMTNGRIAGSDSVMRSRATELLANVGLASRITHRPMELSGGEQQRVAVARALMNDPLLVLADEPTGNLDTETGAIVLNCLFSLTRTRGRSLVVVTHNMELAAQCDRTLRIENGLLLQGRH